MPTGHQNPFRPTRWEHHSDGLPLIWFTDTGELLSADKSAYVYGSRGSGKTSLLRSICWEDLLRNPSLRLQRTVSDSRHIGIYIRLPDHVAVSMGFPHWAELFPNAPSPDWEFYRFFSLAIELICLEKALAAAHELRLSGQLELEAGQELRVVSETLDEYPSLRHFADQIPTTFTAFGRLCRNIVRRMNEASGRGTIPDIVELLPAREPYDLLNFSISRISGVTRLRQSMGEASPGFKFCLDDCEVLNDLQRNSINTLVRKSRFPVSWVVCSVGDVVDIGDTFLPEQPLTDADRRVISLNDRERPDFFNLCQAVASLRTYFSIREIARPKIARDAIDNFFSLEERLGHQDVNDTIGSMLSRSTSPVVAILTKAARALRDALYKIDAKNKARYPKKSARLPFYESYILLHWTGREDAFVPLVDESRIPHMLAQAERLRLPSTQAWMRRKMVGALLHLSSRLGFKRLPIAGANVVVSLSDGSIRDFLEIMAEIYDRHHASRQTPDDLRTLNEKFALSRTKIAAKTQTSGIYAASESFFSGIGAQTDANPESLVRLIEALGRYTSVLQTNIEDYTVLGTTERGIFIVEPSRTQLNFDEKAVSTTLATLHRAELAGYLRVAPVRRRSAQAALRDGDSAPTYPIIAFRLHRRFAPHFRFSYRGAYEPVRLDLDHLTMLCRTDAPLTVDQWLTPLQLRSVEFPENQLMFALKRHDDNED